MPNITKGNTRRMHGIAGRIPVDRAAYEFFRSHGTSRVGWTAHDALSLARAERAAREEGCEWVWEWDDNGWLEARQDHRYGRLSDADHPARVEGCILYGPIPPGGTDADRPVLASLWGIWDASRDYRRVVQAELALEAGYTV